jgi:hypothetical protein
MKPALSFRAFGHSRMTRGTKANHLTGRPRDAPLRRNITITEGLCTSNKGTAQNTGRYLVFKTVLHK